MRLEGLWISLGWNNLGQGRRGQQLCVHFVVHNQTQATAGTGESGRKLRYAVSLSYRRCMICSKREITTWQALDYADRLSPCARLQPHSPRLCINENRRHLIAHLTCDALSLPGRSGARSWSIFEQKVPHEKHAE